MHFYKLVALAALPLLTSAMPGGIEATTTVTVTATATATQSANECSTGSLQCCNSVMSASDQAATSILGLLGIVVNDVFSLVGLGCSPISIVGISGGACSSNAVCCEDNAHNDLISLGCIIIEL